MNRPETTEYAPYYEKYVSLIEPSTLMQKLETQSAGLRQLFAGVTEERGTYRYEPEKWTLKESLAHVIDGERMFAYRVLRISRGDTTPIEGFEQEDYIANSNANNRQFSEMLEEFDLVRKANLILFKNLDDEALKRRGTASDNVVSTRALIYIMAGHLEHHFNIFREKYLA